MSIGNRISLFFLLLVSQGSDLYFVKIGPCFFPRKITCPDPHIKFYLYTSANTDEPQEVDPKTQDAILTSHFNAQNHNKVIIHGFAVDPTVPGVLKIKDAYLSRGDYNVWMVNYKVMMKFSCYRVVVASLNHIGACVAQLIQSVQNVSTPPYQDLFHLIGFSIGAHVSAYTAKHLRPYKLPRITALDPACSFWPVMDFNKKLKKADAHFVDVVHTDAMGMGKLRRLGHVDFYMNGGFKQPGCANRSLLKYADCNHQRVVSYFAESITSKVGFWGYPCKSLFGSLSNKCPPTTPTILMGEYCNNETVPGYYIIPTAAQEPFALGKNIARGNSNASQPGT